MKAYHIIALALLVFTFPMLNAQSLIGGSGTCKTNGDPDLIPGLQDIDQRYICSQAWDTVNNVLYVYDAGATIGQRWAPIAGDNLGSHLAAQLLDMNRFDIQKVDAVSGGVDVSNNDNVAKIGFNSDIGSTVPANAMSIESNAGLMFTSDRNDNAQVKSTEPILFSQGSINSDSPSYYELLRMSESAFRIGGQYNMAMTAPPEDGSAYVQSWTNGANAWTSTSTFGGGSGGVFEIENSNTLASNNTTNNYHTGNIGIGDFSSSTIGATFHVYDPAMTLRLSDSCSTDQCATPQLEFYRGRNTSLLGRAGFLSSADNDFSFINNIATGKLKFGTDATVKLELLSSGQARLNQYTASNSFSGSVAGYLAFDSNGYLITDSGTTGGGGPTAFTGLTDTPGSYTGQAGQYLRVNTGETGLEFVNAPTGGTSSSYPTSVPNNTGLSVILDLNEESTGIFTLIANSRTRYEVRDTNPPISNGGHYTLILNSTSTDTISFPNDFKYSTGVNIGSLVSTSGGVMIDFIYNGSSFFTEEINGVSSISAPTCWDGIQNGDETGVDCGGSCPTSCGGGSTYDADYQAILDYATTQGYTLPSSSVQDDQNQLVLDIKTAGVWDSLDVMYVFATDGDRDFAKINWAGPGSHNATESGTMTFTSGTGFKSNGSNGYLNTNYNLALSTVHYAVDYGQIMSHLNTTGINWPAATAICGARASSSITAPQLMIQNSSASETIVRMQSYGNTIGQYEFLSAGAPGGLTGTYFFDRPNGNTLTAYHNNTQYGTDATSGNHPLFPSQNVYLFANNTGGTAGNFNSAEMAMWIIGGFGSQRAALHTAWDTYATAIGGL